MNEQTTHRRRLIRSESTGQFPVDKLEEILQTNICGQLTFHLFDRLNKLVDGGNRFVLKMFEVNERTDGRTEQTYEKIRFEQLDFRGEILLTLAIEQTEIVVRKYISKKTERKRDE